MARVDGSQQVRLTNGAADDHEPAWSPDGMRLAFRSTRSGWSDIWVMDANGSSPRNLTGSDVRVGNLVAQHPAWSPDGSVIAYSV